MNSAYLNPSATLGVALSRGSNLCPGMETCAKVELDLHRRHLIVYDLFRKLCADTEALRTMSVKSHSAAFEELALPLLPSLYNHAFWLARNPTEAEDLVQEAIAKALHAFHSFEQGTNFKAWIFRILRNTFLTSRTGIATANTVFLEDQPGMLEAIDAGPTPEDNLIRLDNQAALHAALDQLQQSLRDALLLCDVEELKYKEIALILNIPIGTVMSRISRARIALRQIVQSQLGHSQ